MEEGQMWNKLKNDDRMEVKLKSIEMSRNT